MCTEFATSSRRLPTDSVDNLETEHVENLSCRFCVSGVNAPVCCRDRVYNKPISSTLQEIANWVMAVHGCVHTVDTTQLHRCWQICSDPWRLSPSPRTAESRFEHCCRHSPTSCEFCTHRRRDSTRQLSRVGGVYRA